MLLGQFWGTRRPKSRQKSPKMTQCAEKVLKKNDFGVNFRSNFALVEARGALVEARGAFRGGFERFCIDFRAILR